MYVGNVFECAGVYTCVHLCVYVHMYVCVCVCVCIMCECVCVWERDKTRQDKFFISEGSE